MVEGRVLAFFKVGSVEEGLEVADRAAGDRKISGGSRGKKLTKKRHFLERLLTGAVLMEAEVHGCLSPRPIF